MSATYAHLTSAHRDLLARSETLARDILAPIQHGGEPGRVNRELVAALSRHGLVPEVLERGRDAHAAVLLADGGAPADPDDVRGPRIQANQRGGRGTPDVRAR